MDWAEQINRWLEENDRSPAWLARKAGISAEHLYRCLADKTNMGPRALRKLERATGMILIEESSEIKAKAS